MLVLFVPGLNGLFMVAPSFRLIHLGQVAGLAFLPTLVIQIVKIIAGLGKGRN